jgi:hypothetical protein
MVHETKDALQTEAAPLPEPCPTAGVPGVPCPPDELSADLEVVRDSVEWEKATDRRVFLRGTIQGVAGMTCLGALGEFQEARAQGTSDSGQITVDGLLLTYLGAPLGSDGTTDWTITKSHGSTFRISSAQNRSISISSTVSSGLPFSVGSAITYTQSSSSEVANAATVRQTTSVSFGTPAPGVAGNTVLVGLQRPQFQFDGTPSNLRFRLLKADLVFAKTVSQLQSSTEFGRKTIDSFLSQYVPLVDPSGSTLVKPRFKLKALINLGAGVPSQVTFSKSKGTIFSEDRTSTYSVEIVNTREFKTKIFQAAFSVGNRIEVTHSASQETSTEKEISVTTTLMRQSDGITKVFFDRVYKTFCIIDAGRPATSGQAIVRGRITDPAGAAIPGALVKLRQNNTDYAALTDAQGRYTIATAPGQPLASGNYPITSGNVSQNVNVSAGVTSANLGNVNPRAARERLFDFSLE